MKKRLAIWILCFAVSVLMSGNAFSQGKGRGAGAGKPASTGLDRAETKASPQGQKGIDNAEAKQAEHKDADKDQAKGKKKGKHKGKAKGRKRVSASAR